MDLVDEIKGLSRAQEVIVIRNAVKRAVRDNGLSIDWGVNEPLKYYSMDIPVTIGTVDLLLADTSDSVLYVVQVNPEEATAEDVGILSAYLGWFQQSLPAPFREVKGILLAGSFGTDASLAVNTHPSLVAKIFTLTINVSIPD